MSKKSIQDTIWHVLSSTLGTQRAVDTNLKFHDAILQSINSSIVETEKLIKENCGLSTDDIAKRLTDFTKESKD